MLIPRDKALKHYKISNNFKLKFKKVNIHIFLKHLNFFLCYFKIMFTYKNSNNSQTVRKYEFKAYSYPSPHYYQLFY